jgi:hypothetical protein
MRRKLWTFVRRHLVDDVPDEMSACLECGAVQCRQDKYETCPNRLAHAEALRAARSVDGGEESSGSQEPVNA